MSKPIIPLSALIASLMLCHPASSQNVTWQAMFDQGKAQAGSGNYAEAEKSYASALESAEKLSTGDPRLMQTVKALGSVYYQDGKLGKAKDLFKRAVSADEQENNGVNRNLALDLDNLAAVCYRQDNYFEAEPLYKQAIEIWRKLSSGQADQGKSSIEAADDQAKLAMVYERTGKYAQGESLLKTVIETYQSGAPATNKQMATALSYLASFYRKQGKLPEAEKVCRQGLDLRKATCGAESVEVAASMIELGKIYMEEDNPGKYEPLFKQALTIREKALGADHPDVADSLVQLAAAMQMQGRYNAALPLLQRALAIDEVAYGDMHPQVAKITGRMAVILDKKKQYTRAVTLLQKAYDIDKTVFGDASPALANDATNLAMTYLNQGQYESAEEKYKEALAITEKQLGAEHPDTATCLTSLALLYETQSKFGDAVPLLKRALIIRSKAFEPTHPWVARSLFNLGSVYDAQKDFAKAEKFLQTARKVAIPALGSDHPDVAAITLELANVYQQEKKYKEAEELFNALLDRDKAVAGDKAFDGVASSAVALDLMSLSRLALLQGHTQQAADLRGQARKSNTKVSELDSAAGTTTTSEALVQKGAATGGQVINDKWALVVGISNFKDPSINLRYAAKDATDFRNYLINEAHFAPDHVRLLTDKAATREGIVSNLGDQWLRRVADCNDMVVVYISTHGSNADKQTSNANFLIPYETNFSNLLLTGIPMQWLTSALKDLVHCDHVVMILDVCHGGAAAPSDDKADTPTFADPDSKLAGKGLVRLADPRQLKLGNGQIVVASSEASQLSWESKSYPNGVFTRRLIEALRQRGDKTGLTEAFDTMKLKVEEEVLRDRAEVQTPIIFRKWQGEDAILGVLPAKPRKGAAMVGDPGQDKNPKITGSKGPGGRK